MDPGFIHRLKIRIQEFEILSHLATKKGDKVDFMLKAAKLKAEYINKRLRIIRKDIKTALVKKKKEVNKLHKKVFKANPMYNYVEDNPYYIEYIQSYEEMTELQGLKLVFKQLKGKRIKTLARKPLLEIDANLGY